MVRPEDQTGAGAAGEGQPALCQTWVDVCTFWPVFLSGMLRSGMVEGLLQVSKLFERESNLNRSRPLLMLKEWVPIRWLQGPQPS